MPSELLLAKGGESFEDIYPENASRPGIRQIAQIKHNNGSHFRRSGIFWPKTGNPQCQLGERGDQSYPSMPSMMSTMHFCQSTSIDDGHRIRPYRPTGIIWAVPRRDAVCYCCCGVSFRRALTLCQNARPSGFSPGCICEFQFQVISWRGSRP